MILNNLSGSQVCCLDFTLCEHFVVCFHVTDNKETRIVSDALSPATIHQPPATELDHDLLVMPLINLDSDAVFNDTSAASYILFSNSDVSAPDISHVVVFDDHCYNEPVIAQNENEVEPTYDEQPEERIIPSRKRKRNENLWNKNKRKKLINAGKEYVSSSGKTVPAKQFPGLKDRCCRRHCAEKLKNSECETLFNQFWAIGDYSTQNTFIAGCVEQTAVSTHRVPSSSVASKARQHVRKFSVQTGDRVVSVCKTAFLTILGISSGRLNTVMRNQRMNGGVTVTDKRGKYDHVQQRIAKDKVQFVVDHIKSFPVNDSHYTRAHSESRQYLSTRLNIRKMYTLYVMKCTELKQEPVKYWCYRNVFNNKFNLSFHPPRKDTCKTCDTNKILLDNEKQPAKKMEIKCQHELHLRKAEIVRSHIQIDREMTQASTDHDSFTFDLQKVFSAPSVSASEAYYCRQLNVYNLGIHSLTTNHAYMHVWDESVASRGAEDIASCLMRYCSEKANAGVTRLSAYSDACGGQNRNYKVALMWMHICMSTAIELIDHKFMVSGHSFLPNDSDFGVIEKATVKDINNIHIPEQWYQTIEQCKRKEVAFKVVRMQQNDFVSITELAKYATIRKTDDNGQKVEWLKIQHIQIRKDMPMKMFYKYSVQDDLPFDCVSFVRKGRPLKQYSLKLLHSEPRPLSVEKANDLKKLLKYVPPAHHSFYEGIIKHARKENDM